MTNKQAKKLYASGVSAAEKIQEKFGTIELKKSILDCRFDGTNHFVFLGMKDFYNNLINIQSMPKPQKSK